VQPIATQSFPKSFDLPSGTTTATTEFSWSASASANIDYTTRVVSFGPNAQASIQDETLSIPIIVSITTVICVVVIISGIAYILVIF
jgi:hypothetical protein